MVPVIPVVNDGCRGPRVSCRTDDSATSMSDHYAPDVSDTTLVSTMFVRVADLWLPEGLIAQSGEFKVIVRC